MTSFLSEKMTALAKDVESLALATGGVGWDRDTEDTVANPSDLGGLPIPRDQWGRALLIAGELTRANPSLDPPVPGADPEGFVWLTWTQGDKRGLALELRRGQFKWTQRDENGKKTITSDSLDDVAESMRTVFRRTTQ